MSVRVGVPACEASSSLALLAPLGGREMTGSHREECI